jgi:hypothetical protein
LAANRQNIKLSHGPITPKGRERVRAAHLRHGFYAEDVEVAMRALGEDPAHLQELTEDLWLEFDPRGSMQEGLVIRLARATWLMNRADRMQEGYAVRQAMEVSRGRQDRLHALIMRMKMTEDRLGHLAEAVADEHYVTTQEDLARMKNLHEQGNLEEMGDIALALFYQLQAPGTDEDGMDQMEQVRMAVREVSDIFGMGMDHKDDPPVARQPLEEGRDERYPQISPAEWEARERPRQLLENILNRQVERCAALRKASREELRKGPSPFERAAEIAPTHPNSKLMRRMQDSNFREARRITNLLLKLKGNERRMEALEEESEVEEVTEVAGVKEEVK